MPLPEGYLPREGDILLICVEVKYDLDQDDIAADKDPHVHVFPIGNKYSSFHLPMSGIESLHCLHWDVGAEVQLKHHQAEGRLPGEVMAIHAEMAWVKLSDGCLRTVHANLIEPRQSYLEKVREQYDTSEPPPSPVAAAVAAGRAPTLEEVATTVTEEKPDVQF